MMRNEFEQSTPRFAYAWLVVGLMCFSQIIYILLCHLLQEELQAAAIAEEQRVLIRTVFYVVAIVSFPMTSLIRHVQLRLNKTMPGDKPMNKRYLLTVIVSQAIMESVGVLGFVMFVLGDDFNTLYIFSTLAFLGFFLHRPKTHEYQSLLE